MSLSSNPLEVLGILGVSPTAICMIGIHLGAVMNGAANSDPILDEM